MKSFREIKRYAERGDYSRVADIANCSPSLVRKVVYEQRTDHHKIQKIFSDILETRERIAEREARRRERKLLAA